MTTIPAKIRLFVASLFLIPLMFTVPALGEADKNKDLHYTDAGFFDVHICNWPDRPLFFKALFSTPRFNELSTIEVFYPDGRPLGQIGLGKYRVIHSENEPEKRVFMADIDVPDGAPAGIYRARAVLNNGEIFQAQDQVMIQRMPQATGMQPAPENTMEDIPGELSWEAVPGARFYQVFLRDLWQDGTMVFESQLVREPQVAVPAGILARGGYYSWKIHARDVNEDILLGDFNHGSINREATFSIAD